MADRPGVVEIGGTEIAEVVRQFRDAKDAIEQWERVADEARAALLDYATEHGARALTVDGFKVVRISPSVTPGRWDKDRLRRDLGDAWHAYWIEGRPTYRVALA